MGLAKATQDSSRAEVYPLVPWMPKWDRVIIYHELGGRWQLLGVYTVLQDTSPSKALSSDSRQQGGNHVIMNSLSKHPKIPILSPNWGFPLCPMSWPALLPSSLGLISLGGIICGPLSAHHAYARDLDPTLPGLTTSFLQTCGQRCKVEVKVTQQEMGLQTPIFPL